MSFLTRLRELVKRIEPPEDLIVEVGGSKDQPWVRVKTFSMDTYDNRGEIPLMVHVPEISNRMSDEELFDRILVEMLTLRDHELRESFKVDGKPYREPHEGRHEDGYDVRRVHLRNIEGKIQA